MARVVRGGLIQIKADVPLDGSMDDVKARMIDKHMPFIEEAGRRGVQVLCLQELFYGPYFCAEQKTRWYDLTERVPDGPTIRRFQDLAKQLGMVMIVPIYEEENTGVYYNTAAVIDADGRFLGKYRKHHIPQVAPGFWEKYYFRPGNTGYPVFETAAGRIGVYICYDRHFPEGARILGLNGAEIVFNPSATVAGLTYSTVVKSVSDDVRPVKKAADTDAAEGADLRLVIEEDEEPGRYVYTIIDRRTGRVVNRLQREEVLKLRDDQGYAAGGLIDSKA